MVSVCVPSQILSLHSHQVVQMTGKKKVDSSHPPNAAVKHIQKAYGQIHVLTSNNSSQPTTITTHIGNTNQ